jgi:hypothetical protein
MGGGALELRLAADREIAIAGCESLALKNGVRMTCRDNTGISPLRIAR